ncbi:MAG: DUF262 domain-containing protein [Bacteroidales bacterium]|jgi:hypothetical protein|nr:DUF262 domain-containing protein [Bacteroidales bacterium]
MNTKEYTFCSLFKDPVIDDQPEVIIGEIEIPIIQRDYAQGRTTDEVKQIRSRFLDALFNSITRNKHITLDFIYGNLSENKGKTVLTPLDGQQRLTTLFLLHWYIAKKENIDSEQYEFLSHFSYATRFSSRDFCHELVKYTPDFSNEKLSEWIKDQSWYPYEWKNDPTIQSMLVMIDAIHEKFNSQKNLWQFLTNNVSFYFLSLPEMKDTDDLYIKMNSRGKPLTPFEHFKAEFEEIIKKHSKELSKEINHKFDVEWTRMLFPFCDNDNIIDYKFMRYFHFVGDIICYRSEIDLEKDEFKLVQSLYGKENEKAEENIEYLKGSFDCWYNINNIEDFFNKFFSNDEYESDKVKLYQHSLNIFKECCDGELTLGKTLLLFSINTYLLHKDKVSENEFRKRIRIIRNLIWNSSSEIREERMKTLLSESEIVILTGNIPMTDTGFNVWQKKEEHEKIEWLKTNPQMEDELFHLEDHSLLKGCIAAIGLENVDNFKKFRSLFNKCNRDLINRALLSIQDYSQFVSSWRYQIGVKNGSDSVWINLFHPTSQREHFDKTSIALNSLLSKLDELEINDEGLKQLIDKYLNNPEIQKDWRFYFIKYDSIRRGGYGMFYWLDKTRTKKPYEIIMMNTEKSLTGRNWNIFLYTLYNLYNLSEFKHKLFLGDFYFQGNKLKIIGEDIEIDCLNDKYTVSQNGSITEYPIQQSNGIDIDDRIEKGIEILNNIIKNEE